MLLKIRDFHGVKGLSVVLLFVKRVALGHDRFIFGAGPDIGLERVNAAPNGRHFRLLNDGLAKFARFFLDFICHKF